jgi:hypothetical protein
MPQPSPPVPRTALTSIWADALPTLRRLLNGIDEKELFTALCFTVRVVEAFGESMFITAGFSYLSQAFRSEIGFVMVSDGARLLDHAPRERLRLLASHSSAIIFSNIIITGQWGAFSALVNEQPSRCYVKQS